MRRLTAGTTTIKPAHRDGPPERPHERGGAPRDHAGRWGLPPLSGKTSSEPPLQGRPWQGRGPSSWLGCQLCHSVPASSGVPPRGASSGCLPEHLVTADFPMQGCASLECRQTEKLLSEKGSKRKKPNAISQDGFQVKNVFVYWIWPAAFT